MTKTESSSSEDAETDDEDAYKVYECPGLAPVCTALSVCSVSLSHPQSGGGGQVTAPILSRKLHWHGGFVVTLWSDHVCL